MVARRNPVVPRRTVRVDGCPVQTTVTTRPAVARRWLYTTLWRQRRRLHPAGVEPRPGTLQLCCGNRCLVFQLARVGGAVPQILRRFLADARVTFAGYYVASDCRKLRAHHGLEVESTLELCGAGGGTGRPSMASMARRLLGIRHGVEKPMKLSRSRWDGAKLSREQVRYAAADAYISCRLGVHLRCRAAVHVADQDDESEVEYSDDDEHGGWGRFSGFLERVSGDQQDWEASVDDHVYDSMCSVVY